MAEELNPHVCAVCSSPDVVTGYTLPLCKPCREIAIRRPIPIWLRGVILIVGCCAVYAALHLPRELEAAIALDRGETAASKHDYANAVTYYNKALAFYPKAPLVLGRLAVAAAHT